MGRTCLSFGLSCIFLIAEYGGVFAMKKILVMLLGFLLIGCASAPSQEEIENADYGSFQSQDDCIRISESKIRRTLKDPSSAQFTHGTCYKGYWGTVPIYGLDAVFGYVHQGTVNAKNSFGGYTGASTFSTVIRDGYVVRYCVTDNNGLCGPRW